MGMTRTEARLFRSGSDMIWATDRDRVLLAANRMYRDHVGRTFGVRPRVGTLCTRGYPDRDRRLWMARCRYVLKNHVMTCVDHYRLNGEDVFVEFELRPLVSGARIDGLQGFGRVVTDRERAARRQRQLSRRLEVVLASTTDLASLITNPAQLYGTILDRLGRAVRFNSGTVQVKRGNTVNVVAFRGSLDPEIVMGLEFPMDVRFPNYDVVRHGRTRMIADVRAEFPHFKTESDEFGSGEIRTWMGVPMKTGAEVIGMIALDRNRVQPFTEEETRIVEAFANYAAVSIHNARVYRELEEVVAAKESLMRELHHRVKNNLQLISSLISLHDDLVQDVDAKNSLNDLRVRVLSIAAVHERLYESAEAGTVDLGAYTLDIVNDMRHAYAKPGADVRIETDTAEIPADLSQSVPYGLILSELILNSFKHAFPDGTGLIQVSLRLGDGHAMLHVRDNGAGFPLGADGAETGFGVTLVRNLAAQLGGTADVTATAGTEWAVRFPI